MNLLTIHTIWTVLLIVLFVGIVYWAWHGNNKEKFKEAANLPLNDDVDESDNNDKSNNNTQRTKQ